MIIRIIMIFAMVLYYGRASATKHWYDSMFFSKDEIHTLTNKIQKPKYITSRQDHKINLEKKIEHIRLDGIMCFNKLTCSIWINGQSLSTFSSIIKLIYASESSVTLKIQHAIPNALLTKFNTINSDNNLYSIDNNRIIYNSIKSELDVNLNIGQEFNLLTLKINHILQTKD